MATYDSTKICYKYNKETYIYEGTAEATLDRNALVKFKKIKYIFPDNTSYGYTLIEPNVVDENGIPVIEENESLVFNPVLEWWSTQKKYVAERPLLVKPSQIVYSDMNTRILDYNKDSFLTDDARAVFQSIYRLITTDEGEIPYYRTYGCNLKRFLQAPLTEDTANVIYEYLVEKVETFETRGELISTEAGADLNNNMLIMKLYVQCKATGETAILPDLYVKVNRNRG